MPHFVPPMETVLRDIHTSIQTEPVYQDCNSPTADQHITAIDWDVSPQNPYGYRYVRVVENMHVSFPDPSDNHWLQHSKQIIAAQTALGKSSLGTTMREAGIATETTSSERNGYRVTNYHVAYPPTNTFVAAANAVLRKQNKPLRFSAFDGGIFPARILAESAATDPLTVPIGTAPHHNGHDILTHGLGWMVLAEGPLAERYLAPIQNLARAALSKASSAEQEKASVEFGDFVEYNINSVWLARPYERKFNFHVLAKLAQVPLTTVLEDIHTHLYPGKTPAEAYLM